MDRVSDKKFHYSINKDLFSRLNRRSQVTRTRAGTKERNFEGGGLTLEYLYLFRGNLVLPFRGNSNVEVASNPPIRRVIKPNLEKTIVSRLVTQVFGYARCKTRVNLFLQCACA